MFEWFFCEDAGERNPVFIVYPLRRSCCRHVREVMSQLCGSRHPKVAAFCFPAASRQKRVKNKREKWVEKYLPVSS